MSIDMETESKLQEITRKLYEEGLSKGKAEGDRILAEARAEAERSKKAAEAEVAALRAQATAEIAKEKESAEAELKRCLRQMLAAAKTDLEENLLQKTVEPAVKAAFEQDAFIKELLLETVRAFGQGEAGAADLTLLLPEDRRQQYDAMLQQVLGQALQAGLQVQYRRDLQHGFQVQNREKGYKLSFTEADFTALFKQYARENLRRWLF